MFSLLISVISICLVIIMTVLSITADGGGGIDWGDLIVFFMGVAGFGLFLWGFFLGVKKALGRIPKFWEMER
jgi:hypothetical protein